MCVCVCRCWLGECYSARSETSLLPIEQYISLIVPPPYIFVYYIWLISKTPYISVYYFNMAAIGAIDIGTSSTRFLVREREGYMWYICTAIEGLYMIYMHWCRFLMINWILSMEGTVSREGKNSNSLHRRKGEGSRDTLLIYHVIQYWYHVIH